LAQKELDQEKALRTKLHIEAQNEFERSRQEDKNKYARTCEENEARLADLKRAHAQQCDELCREILKANMEADRLHTELKSKGVHVPRRALFYERNATTSAHYFQLMATFITCFVAVSSSRRMP
jgi:hypothetical protein